MPAINNDNTMQRKRIYSKRCDVTNIDKLVRSYTATANSGAVEVLKVKIIIKVRD